jgi:hypothetical protein
MALRNLEAQRLNPSIVSGQSNLNVLNAFYSQLYRVTVSFTANANSIAVASEHKPIIANETA